MNSPRSQTKRSNLEDNLKHSSRFLTSLKLLDIDGSKMQLTEPLYFYWGREPMTIMVPAGVISDFASVPRIFWPIIPRSGKWNKAAVLHDAGYRNELVWPASGKRLKFSRETYDHMFLDALRAENVSFWRRAVLYLAVRLFGGIARTLSHAR